MIAALWVAVATPFYEYSRWLIEQTVPYMPLGKLEEFVPCADERTKP